MLNAKYTACVEACNACALACNHCASSCLKENDVKMMAHCIELDIDCAAACTFAAGAMARGSEHATAIFRLCADVCDACAAECGKHRMNHCQECAAACRRCADECRKMAATA